jgi:hypothetical protein
VVKYRDGAWWYVEGFTSLVTWIMTPRRQQTRMTTGRGETRAAPGACQPRPSLSPWYHVLPRRIIRPPSLYPPSSKLELLTHSFPLIVNTYCKLLACGLEHRYFDQSFLFLCFPPVLSN